MATKNTRKTVSMADEDAAFFRSAYKNDPKARAAMDKAGVKPPAAQKKTTAKKTGKK